MKKIILLILISFAAQSQTLVKTKQIGDGLGTGSVVVSGGTNGSLTYSTTTSLPFIPTSSVSAFVPYSGATTSVNLGAQSFSVGGAVNTGLSAVNTSTKSVFRLGVSSSQWADFGDNGGFFSLWFHRNGSKTTTNYNIEGDEYDLILNDSSSVQIKLSGSNAVNITNSVLNNTGTSFFNLTPRSFQKTTLAEYNPIRTEVYTQGFGAGGTLATYRSNLYGTVTYSATSPATITNMYANYFMKGTAGTSLTITNNYGFATDGMAQIVDKVRIGSTTAPSATLDVTGTMSVSSTFSAGGLITGSGFTGTGGNSTFANGNLSSITTLTARNLNSTATQSLVSGSTSGNANFSQPFQGSSYKKVIIYCNALLGKAAYTFPVAFVNTPMIMTSDQVAAAVITGLSTTTITLTGATTTGYITIEGY